MVVDNGVNPNGKYISPTIAQAAVKGKFLEFQDYLVPAYMWDFAMMQGAVGKEHAPNSGIKLKITDYSVNGTTQISQALVPCYVFEQIQDICLKNNSRILVKGGDLCRMASTQNRVSTSYRTVINEMLGAIAEAVKNGGNVLPLIGRSFKSAMQKLNGKNADNTVDPTLTDYLALSVPMACDYNYEQTRVNSSYPNADHTVPCSYLKIVRETYKRSANGQPEEARNPWSVTISQFAAMPKNHANGTVSYDSSTVTGKVELQCSISDAEMSRCVYAVQHFISQWERANLSSFIDGMYALDEQRNNPACGRG